jgi:hypothetical protein
MMRIIVAVFTAMLMWCVPQLVSAAEMDHRMAFHVDQNDPRVMNMALNNIKNLYKYYDSKGEKIEIELVAYGPGLMMLREDKSPVADRISTMALEYPNLSFSACGNTYRAMSRKAGKDVPLLSDASIVPSGVVRLVELQEAGYSYIRP